MRAHLGTRPRSSTPLQVWAGGALLRQAVGSDADDLWHTAAVKPIPVIAEPDAGPQPAGGSRSRRFRWFLAGVGLCLTLLVVVLCVWDGLTVSSPASTNLRFEAGRYHVLFVAQGDILGAAGVQPGDELIAFGGQGFTSPLALPDQIRGFPLGTQIPVSLLRNGKALTLTAVTRANLTPLGALRFLIPIALLIGLGAGLFWLRNSTPGIGLFLSFCLANAVNDACMGTSVAGSAPIYRFLALAYALFSLQGAAFLLHFFLTFPQRRLAGWGRTAALFGIYGIPLGLGLIYWLPTLFPGLAAWGLWTGLRNVLSPAFSVHVVLCYTLAAFSLVLCLRGMVPFRVRQQAKLLIGAFALLLLLQGGLWELPLQLTGKALVGRFTFPLFDLVVPGAVALAIVVHRMFDINVLLRQGMVYFAASAAVAGLFIFLMGSLGWLLQRYGPPLGTVAIAVAAAVAAIVFHPVRLAAQAGVDRIFYRKRYDYRHALTEIAGRLAGILDIEAAVQYIRGRISRLLQPEWVLVVARRPTAVVFDQLEDSGSPQLFCEGGEAEQFEELLAVQLIPFRPQRGAVPGERRPALVVPIVRGDQVVGALLLGPRPADVPYVAEDRDFLATLASLAGTVLERSRLLEERSLQERLAFLGSATSALVHELKNPLAAMKSAMAVLRRRINDDSRGQELTGIVDREIDRLQDTIINVLSYVRPQQIHPIYFDLAELLRQLVGVVEADFQVAKVQVTLEADPLATMIWGDSGRLRQLFLNLLLNAREALVRGGQIMVAVRPWTGSDGVTRGALVQVRDNGPGFPVGDLQRVFEPFFTTKRLGTGLGLANVRRIVEEHGGQVTAANHAEGGAVVTVWLPGRPGER